MHSKASTSGVLVHDAGQVRLGKIRIDEIIKKFSALQQAILNSANNYVQDVVTTPA